MSPSTAFLILAFSSLLNAQVTEPTTLVTWASFVYTYHGEKTPILPDATSDSLTPLGASQLYSAGSVIHDRYMSTNSTELTFGTPVNGLSDGEIANTQLQILSTSDEYVMSSAQAFMQGLYPPTSGVNGQSSVLGNGSVVNYPLGGYQYPNINSVSELDYNYIWIAGNNLCTEYEIASTITLTNQTVMSQISNTRDFYRSLADTFFSGISEDLLNWGNAVDLYEYALYQYNHNSSVYNSSKSATLLNTIYELASEEAQYLNTPSPTSSVQTISGQALSSYLLQQFSAVINSNSISDKLTLLFGSYEPMLAFFYLSSLSTSSLTSSQFTTLPLHGSSMVFELFSYVPLSDSITSSNTFPSPADLYVRFLFRNGTADTDPLISYPLFNRGNSEIDMAYNDFVTEIGKFSISGIVEWCQSCDSITLFCEAVMDNEVAGEKLLNGGSGRKGVNGVVGGIIGAFVTLMVLLLLGVILVLLGFRMEYRGKRNGSAAGGVLKRGSKGGFKGAERKEEDKDVAIAKDGEGENGVRHERVGSWELRDGMGGLGANKKERVVSTADYSRKSEDGIGAVDPFGKGVQGEDYV